MPPITLEIELLGDPAQAVSSAFASIVPVIVEEPLEPDWDELVLLVAVVSVLPLAADPDVESAVDVSAFDPESMLEPEVDAASPEFPILLEAPEVPIMAS